MVERIGGAIIKFSLRHPKFWWSGLAHYLREERWFHIKLDIERVRRSNFEGLQLMSHVIDLSSKIGPPKISTWEGPLIIGGLDNESRTGRVMRFETLIAWMFFRYRRSRRWLRRWLTHLKGDGRSMQNGLLQPLDRDNKSLDLLQ